jgi:hypothetical protein
MQSNMTAQFGREFGFSAADARKRREFIDGPMREVTYIHCWHGSDVESPDMWQEFAESGTGVCIQTTASRLMQAMSSTPDLSLEVRGVTYSNDHPVSELFSFMAACRKHTDYRNEKEFRIMGTLSFDAVSRLSMDDHSMPEFQLVPVSFDRLFQAVWVGPNAEGPVYDQIELLVNTVAGSRVTRRSALMGS